MLYYEVGDYLQQLQQQQYILTDFIYLRHAALSMETTTKLVRGYRVHIGVIVGIMKQKMETIGIIGVVYGYKVYI